PLPPATYAAPLRDALPIYDFFKSSGIHTVVGHQFTCTDKNAPVFNHGFDTMTRYRIEIIHIKNIYIMLCSIADDCLCQWMLGAFFSRSEESERVFISREICHFRLTFSDGACFVHDDGIEGVCFF